MITEIIKIGSDGKGAESALAVTDKAAAYGGLDPKESIRLTLLSEELIGLFKSIAGDISDAGFWIEQENKEFKIHMKATVEMNQALRKEFLSISRSGKNAAAKGFMGKLKDLISTALMPESDPAQRSIPVGFVSMDNPASSEQAASLLWTLQDYRTGLNGTDKSGNEDEWDELEKSIVANIADDVQVSVNGAVVDVAIIKKF